MSLLQPFTRAAMLSMPHQTMQNRRMRKEERSSQSDALQMDRKLEGSAMTEDVQAILHCTRKSATSVETRTMLIFLPDDDLPALWQYTP